MLSDLDMAGFPIAAPLSEVSAQANIDADLLLVSQIGGLRAKSAQARAANAKLNAAIVEARERQESEKSKKLRAKQHHLRILSKWLLTPKSMEIMRCCFGTWHSSATAVIRIHQVEKLLVSRIFDAWRRISVDSKHRRDADMAGGMLEIAANQIETLRQHLLLERRGRRFSRISHEMTCSILETSTTSRASSASPETRMEDCERMHFAFPMGATEHQLCAFVYETWKSLVRLSRLHSRKASQTAKNQSCDLRCWDVVLARLTRNLGWHDTDLCGFVMSQWRAYCSEQVNTIAKAYLLQYKSLTKVAMHEPTRLTRISDAAFSFFAVPLAAITLYAWKVCRLMSARAKVLRTSKGHILSQWLELNLRFKLGDVFNLWAGAASKLKLEAECAAQGVEMRVLQRRALNAAFSTTLDSERSWHAAMIFYRWRSEILHAAHYKLLNHSAEATKRHASARSRMIALLHLSQLESRLEHLTLAWNTWRQWQARQNSRRWRDQAQESLIASKMELDTKASARLAFIASARSAVIDSKLTIENLLCLREAFGTLVLHARAEVAMRQFQVRVVNPMDVARKEFHSLRERRRNRLVTQIIDTESRTVASDCFIVWLWEVRSARLSKWSASTTTRFLNNLFDSSPWMYLLPVFPCWCTWKTYVSISCRTRHWNHCKQVQSIVGDMLSVHWKESMMQFFVSAWRLACVVYSTCKLEELETQCDELLRLLEAEKSEREKAVAKTVWQQEILSDLERASQNEARIRCQQAEAEEVLRREAEELHRLQANVFTMIDRFQRHVEAAPQSNDNVLMKRSDIGALVSELHNGISARNSSLLNGIRKLTQQDTQPLGQDSIANCNDDSCEVPVQIENENGGSVQMQSPLTASSPWVENTWKSPHLAANVSPNATAGAPEEASSANDEELFIKRCGELTRQQEAFIAKLKAHPEIGLDELRSQCSDEKQRCDVIRTGSKSCKSWHDISSPLCAVADTPVDCNDACEELLGASLEKPVSPVASTGQYLCPNIVPTYSVYTSAGSEAVCRQLSFEMRGVRVQEDVHLRKLGEEGVDQDENSMHQPRCVSFDLIDEVGLCSFSDPQDDEEEDDPESREISEMQLADLRLKLHRVLENHGSHHEKMRSLDSRYRLPEVDFQEKCERVGEDSFECEDRRLQDDTECQERLEELRKTLLHGLPDFSCRFDAATEDDITDFEMAETSVVAEQHSDMAAFPGQEYGKPPPFVQTPSKEGASVGSSNSRIGNQFLEGLSPQSFATRLQGFSFGMSESLVSSTSAGAARPVVRAASDGQHVLARGAHGHLADVFERLQCITTASKP